MLKTIWKLSRIFLLKNKQKKKKRLTNFDLWIWEIISLKKI